MRFSVSCDEPYLTFIVVTRAFKEISIKSYFRKTVLKDKTFIEAFEKLPHTEDPSINNGKTLWKNNDLRVDWGNNTKLGDKIHFNLQKNQAAKLDGLKKFKTDDKLISGSVEKGKTIPKTEIEEEWEKAFDVWIFIASISIRQLIMSYYSTVM